VRYVKLGKTGLEVSVITSLALEVGRRFVVSKENLTIWLASGQVYRL
jgi:hypothetical protein